jgi:spore maturation protein CgeB
MDSVYSKRIRAGKRRTYFFDVRATRGNDYFLTITESRKRFDNNGYDRHKIFLYKEDFNKFIKALAEAVDYVKTDLMPDFDFDAFNHEYPEGEEGGEYEPDAAIISKEIIVEPMVEAVPEPEVIAAVLPEEELPIAFNNPTANEEVDKW